MQKKIYGIIIIAAVAIVAYTIGNMMAKNSNETKLINNYSFVKNIIELAGLQVSGTTTFKSSNADATGGFWSGIKNTFTENTGTIMVPYTAKYGIAMPDSFRIETKDSIVIISLPATQLLSLELHMDRMETNSRKGLLVFEDDEYFNVFQKKLYTDTRSQLAANNTYLQQSAKRIQNILAQYYQPLGLKVQCDFSK